MWAFALILCTLFTVLSYVFAYRQWKEKGFLLNNAYLYASKEERMHMDKKPYYRQSGVTFFLVGTINLINVIQIITQWNRLFYLVILVAITTIIYAVFSSIIIESSKSK